MRNEARCLNEYRRGDAVVDSESNSDSAFSGEEICLKSLACWKSFTAVLQTWKRVAQYSSNTRGEAKSRVEL